MDHKEPAHKNEPVAEKPKPRHVKELTCVPHNHTITVDAETHPHDNYQLRCPITKEFERFEEVAKHEHAAPKIEQEEEPGKSRPEPKHEPVHHAPSHHPSHPEHHKK
jgi:hypothetical protein